MQHGKQVARGWYCSSMADNDDASWTTVPRTKKRDPPKSTKVDGRRAYRPAPGVTVKTLTKQSNEQQLIWRRSEARNSLCRTLAFLKPTAGWTISKAVCLGFGSFSEENQSNSRRTMTQWAIFMDIVKHLEGLGAVKIEVYAQEVKAVLDVDKAFLASLDVELVEKEHFDDKIGPVGEHFGPQTFACDLFLEHSVDTVTALVGKDNKLVVSTARMWVDTWYVLKVKEFTKEKQAAFRELMHDKYSAFKFPHFSEDPHTVEGLYILGPKPREDDEESD
ncbi:hypothetical protein LTR95_001870 [Oleoguttula sp. CCFEE 5521]